MTYTVYYTVYSTQSTCELNLRFQANILMDFNVEFERRWKCVQNKKKVNQEFPKKLHHTEKQLNSSFFHIYRKLEFIGLYQFFNYHWNEKQLLIEKLWFISTDTLWLIIMTHHYVLNILVLTSKHYDSVWLIDLIFFS